VTSSGRLSYAYDPNGNLATKTEGTDVWGYEWNARDELMRVTKNAIEQARFAYDPVGRRVEKVAGGVPTGWTYDGDGIVREIKGAATFKYVHGGGTDEPLAREDGSGALTYYHADGLGSVAKRTNQAGAVVHEYRYDAWGNIETGATESGYAFTGREWDPEVGLYYYRARYYAPTKGRFISEDPIKFVGGNNFYAYVADNPATWIDPLGLLVEMYCVAIGQGGENRTNAFAGNLGLKHCFLRVKCDCSGNPGGGGYDYRLEVTGQNPDKTAAIPAP
jgi:RHS repeat-associated protein